MSGSLAPVLVGSSAYMVGGDDVKPDCAPQERMALAADAALVDAGMAASEIDSLAVIRTFADSAPQYATPFGGAANYPAAVARRIGARPVRCLYPVLGGNTPQDMVSRLAGDIRAGRSKAALIVAGESMRSAALARKAGLQLDWSEPAGCAAEVPGDDRPGISAHELRHGLGDPPLCYALFESALAARLGRPMSAHRLAIADLFARFSRVAAGNPRAALRHEWRAAEIAVPGPDNRLVAWPYTKRMCANPLVDQAAAIVLTGEDHARALGIAPERFVWLAGSAELDDKWLLSERVDFAAAPAIGIAGRAALEQAGITAAELDLIDLYSCFPVAVELAARELGLDPEDPRGLTVTGGLPFFGGPGNGYSLFAIAETVRRLRERPGRYGLVTANGWYLTKHAIGIYRSAPPLRPWQRRDPCGEVAAIARLRSPAFDCAPEGRGRVEAASIAFARDGTRRGVLFGRLDRSGARFLATVPPGDEATLSGLAGEHPVGLRVQVRQNEGVALAILD